MQKRLKNLMEEVQDVIALNIIRTVLRKPIF